MGDSDTEKKPVDGSDIADSNIPKLIIILLLILAAFAPLAITYSGYWGYSLTIVAISWIMYSSEFGTTFELVTPSPYSLMIIFPFFLFRLALPYQINKYYKGRTTRGRTAVAAVLADLPFIIIFIPVIIMNLLGGGIFIINAPVPIMMIVGILILWRLPMPEAKVPWDGVERSKYWWEEQVAGDSTSDQSESPWKNQK